MTDNTHEERRAQYQRTSQLMHLFYDFQQARIAYEHRVRKPRTPDEPEIVLSEDDVARLARINKPMAALEKVTLKEMNDILDGHPIYEWLVGQRGISVTLAPVLMGALDIFRAESVSQFWRVCGLSVDTRTGRAERPTKGEKLHYSPHLKSRCYLLGECLIKANNTEFRPFYDNYKHRKESQIGRCSNCDGTGRYTAKSARGGGPAVDPEIAAIAGLESELAAAAEAKPGKTTKCSNCNGTGTGPWGNSKKHRHIAAMRYMVKMLLLDLHKRWRTHEGLVLRPSYAEQYLGHVHHDST